MSHFQNILFIADNAKGEKAALTKILQLAARYKARVTVMAVMEKYPESFHTMESNAALLRMYDAILKKRGEELRDLIKVAGQKANKVKAEVLIKQGIDYIEIVRQVKAGMHDLVAKASDNNSGLVGVLFGTLDMQLLRKCPCPVFIMKARKKIMHSKILAAVDLNRSSKERTELDQTIVQLASDMAEMEEGTLDLIHTWQLSFEKKLRNEEKIRSYKTVDVMLKEIRALEKKNLETLVEEFAEIEPRTHLIKGSPQEVIPRFVKARRFDLVVMGTVGRSGVAGFFIGNTAEKILNGLSCSVLAIKPKGFKTPVF